PSTIHLLALLERGLNSHGEPSLPSICEASDVPGGRGNAESSPSPSARAPLAQPPAVQASAPHPGHPPPFPGPPETLRCRTGPHRRVGCGIGLLGRPVSESGRLRHGEENRGRGALRRRVLKLPTLSLARGHGGCPPASPELVIVDVVAQHDEQPHEQLAG